MLNPFTKLFERKPPPQSPEKIRERQISSILAKLNEGKITPQKARAEVLAIKDMDDINDVFEDNYQRNKNRDAWAINSEDFIRQVFDEPGISLSEETRQRVVDLLKQHFFGMISLSKLMDYIEEEVKEDYEEILGDKFDQTSGEIPLKTGRLYKAYQKFVDSL